jgi:hypothetical protein
MSTHGKVRRLVAAGVASLAACAAGSVLAVASGSAFTGYPDVPNAVFGGAGSGAGQFSGPTGVAVDDSSGDVYVADSGNNRVEEFGAEGKYVAQITGAETPAKSFSDPSGVAVDNSSSPAKGDVYVTDVGHNVIDVFDSSGKYLSQIKGTPSSFAGELNGVTVDASGDLWAHENNGNVDELGDTGSFLGGFTALATTPGIAIDSRGEIYLLYSQYYVQKYNQAGLEVANWGGIAGTALAVDGVSNDVFVDVSGSVEEFGPFGEPYGVVVQAFGGGSIASSDGIAVNDKIGTVYTSQSEADTVAVFKPGLLPDVSTELAGKSTRTGVTLKGVVSPDDEAVTSCKFEYGTSTAYGQTVACSLAPGSGSSPVPVSAEISGLVRETVYHYRLVAGNANGIREGDDQAFTTQGAVEGPTTLPGGELQATSVTMNGSLEPNGFDTHAWFEYGESEAYGSTTPHQDVGEGHEVKPVSAALAKLEPNTTYHYRIAAENTLGVTYGADETVTTKMLVPVITQMLPASSITRVTATVSAKLNPEKSHTLFRIVYGETTSYGQHSSEFDAGSGFGEETVSVGLLGLAPGKTYHYAVTATSQAGTVTGPDETLTAAAATPPVAATGGASSITLTSATVAGTIGPEGLPTSYELDFGTDATYGTSIYGEAGYGRENVPVEVALHDLAPGTTYHYRLAAINSDGTTYGADETFTTPAYSAPIVPPFTLPLIATPTIAFPTETEPTQKTVKKKTTKNHRKPKASHERRRAKKAKRKR